MSSDISKRLLTLFIWRHLHRHQIAARAQIKSNYNRFTRQVYGLFEVLPRPRETGSERTSRVELRAVRQHVDDPTEALLVDVESHARNAYGLGAVEQHRLPRSLQVPAEK